MVLERIRRVLGAECPRERFAAWPLGLAALAPAAVLLLASVFAGDIHNKVEEEERLGQPGHKNGLAQHADALIVLQVRALAVSLTKLRNLGMDYPRVLGPDQSKLLVDVLDGLQKDRLAEVLARPQIMTLNNQPATVRIGGPGRVAVPQAGGKWSIEGRFCGLSFECTPTIADIGNVHIKWRLEKSMDRPDRQQTVGRETAPALDLVQMNGEGDYKARTTVVAGRTIWIRVSSPPAKEAVEEFEVFVLLTPEIVDSKTDKNALGKAANAATRPQRR